MTETSYTITVTNEQRIALRRIMRETLTSLHIATTEQVIAGEIDSARRIADEARVARDTLEAIRQACETS